MENCLVQKLKEECNNSALRKLGVLLVHAKTLESFSTVDAQQRLMLKVNDTVKIKALGGGMVSKTVNFSENEVTLEASDSEQIVYISNGNYDIEISNKYAIKTIDNGVYGSVTSTVLCLDIDDVSFSGMDNLEKITLPKTPSYGNIAGVNRLHGIKIFQLNSPEVIGTIDDLNNNSIENLSITSCSQVTGTFDNLGKFANLETIAVAATGITGTIEGFVANKKAAGVASGTVDSSMVLRWIKFGGQTYSGAWNQRYIIWDDHKIIVSDNVDPASASSSIYAKGATAEEISAWEQAGKTVVVVN